MLVLLFLVTSCSAEEPTLKRDAWGEVIPENITYDWVIQQYLKNGYEIDSLASDRPDSFASPQEAWAMLQKEIAAGDSLWAAERMSRAVHERISISTTSRSPLTYCSFKYREIEVFFTYAGGNRIDGLQFGLNDISVGDVSYTIPTGTVSYHRKDPELSVVFTGRKVSTVGGVTLYSQHRSFNYNFVLDLGSMKATTF